MDAIRGVSPLHGRGEAVAQLDDTHLHWKAEIAGKEKEGEAETPADAGPAHCLG